MSYLHCPSCQRAYNLAIHQTCPWCPVAATLVDATADIVAAADQLARAIARATPGERVAAAARLDHLALPAGASELAGDCSSVPIARSIRDALVPPRPVPPLPPPRSQPLLAVVISLVDRIAPRLPAPRIVRRVLSRVRALAAA